MNLMWKKVNKEAKGRPKQKLLSEMCQVQLKSSISVTTFSQCVEELLVNSLDSEPTCISVRVDTTESFIQIVDNGKGIAKKSLMKIGERHSSSKPLPPAISGNTKSSGYYGYRGEALASIIELCHSVEIVSRAAEIDAKTYVKAFKDGIAAPLKRANENRPCNGTTVSIQGLFHKTPVRLKATSPNQMLCEVLQLIQGLAVSVAGKISISLRDECKGKVLLNTSRVKNMKGKYECPNYLELFEN